jgi:hypothetical protein
MAAILPFAMITVSSVLGVALRMSITVTFRIATV